VEYTPSLADLERQLKGDYVRDVESLPANVGSIVQNPRALLGGLASIPGTVAGYLSNRSLPEIAGDVGGFAVDVASGFMSDPMQSMLETFNVPGMAADLGEIRSNAATLRDMGMDEEANQLEQLAAVSLVSFAVPGVGNKTRPAVRAGARAATEAAEAAARNTLEPRFNIADVGGTRIVEPIGAAPQIVPGVSNNSSLEEIRDAIRNTELNQPARLASQYAAERFGRSYDPALSPASSLEKQSGIARTMQEAISASPEYKSALFERYGTVLPELVESSGAQNYDQLVEAAYQNLIKETEDQFRLLPVTTRYHSGDLDYPTPSAMMRDVLSRGNLNVFKGGDPHPFLDAVDPETGLTANEEFRAVHDYFGHVAGGRTFRPSGEEAAYASHSQMMSPLAQIALLAETRGQNSLVNYSTLNAGLVERMQNVNAQLQDVLVAKRNLETKPAWSADYKAAENLIANSPPENELRGELRALGSEWKYSPQAPVLLPPEYLPAETAGGMPSYVSNIISPEAGTTLSSRGVHLSSRPDIEHTDPIYYGKSHRGEEFPAVASGRFGAPRRTYFYLGEEGTVDPELALLNKERFPYEAQLSGLYDIEKDPVGLVTLARAWGREGGASADARAQLDRLIREWGYSGLAGGTSGPWSVRTRPAYVFGKTPVNRLEVKPGHRGYAAGGGVDLNGFAARNDSKKQG
jgi:hypothetical protein